MRKIRVLIVDDSVVIRRLLSDVLSQDAEIEVVGTAANGRIALAKLPQVTPDLVTLDIEMPDLDGLGTLPLLRKDYPKLPVVMFSTLTERGALTTLEALSRGATDYATKPANVGSVAAGMETVRLQLIPKIKALCPFNRVVTPNDTQTSLRANAAKIQKRPSQRCEAIVIGTSTGGPQALATVLKALPANFPVPIAVVQHMPPVFTKTLANRLNQECQLEVIEAKGGETLRPGCVVIAPGDHHLELRRKGVTVVTALHQGPPENSCRPAVDVLFRSAATVYGPECRGFVLTGMGQDGLRGAQQIVSVGGSVVVQDEATSVVWGMPRAVAEAGLAAKIVALSEVSTEMTRCTALSSTRAVHV